MEVDGGGYIMVVRSNLDSDLPPGDIFVTGRLFHRQYEDVVGKSDGALSRLDPSLLVSEFPGDLL